MISRCTRGFKWTIGLALLALVVSYAASAAAQIKNPGAHPRYDFEAEPHLVVSDRGVGGDMLGVGFRGSVVVAHRAFVPSINNSVAIGFGGDMLFIGGDHCHGSGPNRYCHNGATRITLPVVMQWNFWLHKKWSVFGEPGLALFLWQDDYNGSNFHVDVDPFVMMIGGRFHMNESTTLTLRLGYPSALSFGVSFLL